MLHDWRHAVVLTNVHTKLDRFLDVCRRFIVRGTLTHAAWNCRTFGDPNSIPVLYTGTLLSYVGKSLKAHKDRGFGF